MSADCNSMPPPSIKFDNRIFSPFYRNEPYPATVKVDFRKLSTKALERIVSKKNIHVRPDSSHSELAVAVALYFQDMEVKDEGVIINTFIKKHMSNPKPKRPVLMLSELEQVQIRSERAFQDRGAQKLTEPSRRTRSSTIKTNNCKKEAGNMSTARAGEQVACLNMIEQDASEPTWILAHIQKYLMDSDQYQCIDDDDENKIFKVAASNVIRLEDTLQGIEKGDEVLAVYPDTTSFYKATVHRVYRRTISRATNPDEDIKGFVEVRFDDDADVNGRTPIRKLPIRFIFKPPQPRTKEAIKRMRTPAITPAAVYGEAKDDDDQIATKRTKRIRSSKS